VMGDATAVNEQQRASYNRASQRQVLLCSLDIQTGPAPGNLVALCASLCLCKHAYTHIKIHASAQKHHTHPPLPPPPSSLIEVLAPSTPKAGQPQLRVKVMCCPSCSPSCVTISLSEAPCAGRDRKRCRQSPPTWHATTWMPPEAVPYRACHTGQHTGHNTQGNTQGITHRATHRA